MEPKNLPDRPGVYLFKNSLEKVIYVGKARSLKKRVGSYFKDESILEPKTRKMMERAKTVEFIETESEIEALLLEVDLIKRLKPRYNIELKDDKAYQYIVLESFKRNPYPRVGICRRKLNPQSTYFGPFPSGKIVYEVLRLLRHAFLYRDCSETKFERHRRKNQNCLYGKISLCSSPCVGNISKEVYRKNIEALKDFLLGRKKKLVRELEKKMKETSLNQDFETAASFRNQLRGIEYITQHFRSTDDYLVNPNLKEEIKDFELSELAAALFGEKSKKSLRNSRIEAYDVSNVSGKFATGSMVVFNNGERDTGSYRRFKIKGAPLPDDTRMISEVISRRFSKASKLPDLILVDGGIAQLNAVRSVLKSLDLEISVFGLAKKQEKIVLVDREILLPKDSLALNLIRRIRDEAHRFALSYHRKRRSDWLKN